MSAWIRQIHRWTAIVFTAGFVVNFFASMHDPYPVWLGLFALLPLLLLLATGLYMFVLPYATKWRAA